MWHTILFLLYVVRRTAVHDIVHGVVCRGMLCLVYCVVCVVVVGCIICVVFRGVLCLILCLILCAVDYSLACALEYLLTNALERVFSSCLFFRGFSWKPLRDFFSAFPGCCASLTCVVFCVFCLGFSHGI